MLGGGDAGRVAFHYGSKTLPMTTQCHSDICLDDNVLQAAAAFAFGAHYDDRARRELRVVSLTSLPVGA